MYGRFLVRRDLAIDRADRRAAGRSAVGLVARRRGRGRVARAPGLVLAVELRRAVRRRLRVGRRRLALAARRRARAALAVLGRDRASRSRSLARLARHHSRRPGPRDERPLEPRRERGSASPAHHPLGRRRRRVQARVRRPGEAQGQGAEEGASHNDAGDGRGGGRAFPASRSSAGSRWRAARGVPAARRRSRARSRSSPGSRSSRSSATASSTTRSSRIR